MKYFHQYKNGLRLVHHYVPTVRSVAFGISVGTGSAYETEENNGISHFLEHMMFKGTKKRTAFEIVREFESVGAQTNAFTSKHMTCYYFVSLDENAEYCAEILSDMFFNASFPKEEVERERAVILEEISEADDEPEDIVFEQLASVYFAEHPLARPILGSRENVKKITADDLRAYRAETYSAGNVVISIVGNIKKEDATRLADKYFTPNFTGKKVAKKTLVPAPGRGGAKGSVKDIEQVHIAFAFPGVSQADPRRPAVLVLNSAFGSGMSSRLFQKIREKYGLAYTVYSYPTFYPNEGEFSVYTSTNKQNFEATKTAIIDEIKLLIEGGLTETEVECAKNQIKASFVFSQESTSALMRMHSKEAFLRNACFDLDMYLNEINKLDKDSVNAVIADIFDFDRMAVSHVMSEN
ncbi:MAG: insulinase family protein [Clostridiaceae bacterium]|jgi:predicted Zn-dependent peptidase|nr:insulinase family protein [Clostridiaceae bacterium]